MRTIAFILVLTASLAIAGCGGGEEPDGAQQASAPAAPILGGERTPTGGDSANPGQAGDTSTPAAPASVEFDDSSAEAAVATYVNSYMAGDFEGALAICDMESEGAQQLQRTVNGFESARESGVQIDLAGFLVQGLEGIRWERVEDTATEDRVEFQLIAPERERNKTCVAVLTEDGWRVQPDPSGNP